MNANRPTSTDQNQLNQFVRHTATRTARAAEALYLHLNDGDECGAHMEQRREELQAAFIRAETILLDAQRLERQLAA